MQSTFKKSFLKSSKFIMCQVTTFLILFFFLTFVFKDSLVGKEVGKIRGKSWGRSMTPHPDLWRSQAFVCLVFVAVFEQ